MTTVEAIKIILSHKDWSQPKLARELKVAQSSLSRYARGERTPDYDKGVQIIDLAKRVKRSIDRQQANV